MRVFKPVYIARRLALCAALVVSIGVPPLTAPAGAAAACPTPPTGEATLNGTLTEGVMNLGTNAKAEGVSATLTCGTINPETLHYSFPAANVVYAPFKTKLFGFLSLPTTLTVNQPVEGALEARFNELTEQVEGYEATATTSLTATVNFFGFAKCSVGPFPVTLTTGKSGSLEGHYFEGSIGSLQGGRLVANEFAIPRVEASRSCPFFLAWVSNLMLGLPLEGGQSSIATSVSLKPEGPPPTFAGLKSATTCVPIEVQGEKHSYTLRWEPAIDAFTPSEQIVYNVYQATTPGGENFSTPTYRTQPGATSFKTPGLSGNVYFVVRARDQLGLEDSNAVEKRGENPCV